MSPLHYGVFSATLQLSPTAELKILKILAFATEPFFIAAFIG